MLLAKLNIIPHRFLRQALTFFTYNLSTSTTCCDFLRSSTTSRPCNMEKKSFMSAHRAVLGERNGQTHANNIPSESIIQKFDQVPNTSRKQLIIAVEGNIGAGKSTLLKHLGQHRQEIDVIMEPVDDWCNVSGTNMLELLYSDPKRWCFAFNSNAMLARMKMHCDNNSNKPIKIIERSLYATRHVFVEQSHQAGNILDIEMALLDELFNSLRLYCNVKLDKIVYLRADPEVCLQRIKKRGRKEEANLSLEFLSSLHQLYDQWLLNRSSEYGIPVLTIDSNSNVHDKIGEIYESLLHDESLTNSPASNCENARSILI